jgi:hypothetical protein
MNGMYHSSTHHTNLLYSAPCPIGHYSEEFGSLECLPCPKGHYGIVQGADSLFSCIPCPFGTYNDKIGQTNCTACNGLDNVICPVGAITPIDTTFFNRSKVASINYTDVTIAVDHSQSNIRLARNIVLGAGCGAAFILTILFAILVCMLMGFGVQPIYIQKLDRLFNLTHDINEGEPPLKQSTILGAIWTVLAFLLIIVFLTCSLMDYFGMNTSYAQASIQEPVIVKNGTYLLSVSLYGMNQVDCSPDIKVQGFEGFTTRYSYDTQKSSCNLVFECQVGKQGRFVNRNIAQVSLNFQGLGVLYHALDYTVSLPHFGNGQFFLNGQRILPAAGNIFRGPDPTSLFFSLDPRKLQRISGVFGAYFRGVKTRTDYGMSIQPTAVVLGSTVPSFGVGELGAATVTFQFILNPNTLLINEVYSQTILNLIGQVASLTGLIIGIMILLFPHCEKPYNYTQRVIMTRRQQEISEKEIDNINASVA